MTRGTAKNIINLLISFMCANLRSVSQTNISFYLIYRKMEDLMNLPEKPSLREIVRPSYDITGVSKLIRA